jgi:SMODS-associated and fused to various effectors sensor domain
VTDPTGRCFVSYRRTRSAEVRHLVLGLRDLGIPTWQDITNLDAEPTAEELRAVLREPDIASALVWITPDVDGSDIIRKVELPEIVNRKRANDGFFVQSVAAGGLDYAEAGEIASRHLGIEDLSGWNLSRAGGDPIDGAEAAGIAELVLRRRVKEIAARLGDGSPMRLAVHTRERAPVDPGLALTLDWSDRFEGRCATAGAWHDRLLPAVGVVASTVRELAPGRPVEAGGRCALPAALALGAAFLAPAGPELRWRQRRLGATDQVWSLAVTREAAEVDIDVRETANASAVDMAVVASINHDAEEALRESAGEVPAFRGYVRLRGKGEELAEFRSPGEATDAAMSLIEAVKAARTEWRDIRAIHLFIAGPAGFAALFGQLLNGLGPIQTYEHLPDDAIGRYRRAALLHPGA